MASGFESGIDFSLTEVDWVQSLSGSFDVNAIRDALLETGDLIEEIIEQHFEDKQGDWAPLKPSTVKQRIAMQYAASPTLVRSGTLKENVARNKQIEINGSELSVVVFPNDATTPYSDTPISEYAEALDKARPFYDLDDDELNKVFDVLEEKLADKLGFI